MKNKHTIRTLAVLLAVMLCMTAFSTVAFASSEDTVPTSEAQTEPTDSADITGDDLSELISTLFGSVLGGAEKSGKTGTVTTNGGKLNVRTGAGLDNYAFAQLPNGTVVEVVGTDGDWYMVRLPEKIGYVYSGYMTLSDTGGEADSGLSLSIDPDKLSELFEQLMGGSGDAALGAAPRHDRGVGRKPPFENLVPAQQAAALGVEEGLDAADHVALQLIDVFQPLFAHPRGAFGAGAPALLRGFVAADVDILRGEESNHLGKDVFEEFERLFVADAEVGVEIGFPAARKFGEDGQHLLAVARHLDFGDHRDKFAGCIVYNGFDLLLCIVSAMLFAVKDLRIVYIVIIY